MSKNPAFLFYSSDFLTEAAGLTMEERGQYITMMALQHQNGHLNEKTIKLSVGAVSADVLKKFDRDEAGLYFNRQLEETIQRRNAYCESRRRNASQNSTMQSICKAYAPHMENENEIENINEKGSEKSSAKPASCPYVQIMDLYHEICTSFPKIRSIDGERRKAVAARWRQHKSLDTFGELFRLAEASFFLKGDNDRNWHADFDWMMKPSNFAKVLEHKYNGNSTQQTGRRSESYFSDPSAYENMKPL